MDIVRFNNCLSDSSKGIFNEEFYKYCVVKFKIYVMHMFGNKIDAEETAFDIFHYKIFLIKNYSYVLLPNRWLFKVARNYVLDKLKSDKKYRSLIENIDADRVYEDYLERADLKQALRKLEKRPLQVIWLHYFGGYKFKEISQTLGITAKSASNICKSAAKKLNELLS